MPLRQRYTALLGRSATLTNQRLLLLAGCPLPFSLLKGFKNNDNTILNCCYASLHLVTEQASTHNVSCPNKHKHQRKAHPPTTLKRTAAPCPQSLTPSGTSSCPICWSKLPWGSASVCSLQCCSLNAVLSPHGWALDSVLEEVTLKAMPSSGPAPGSDPRRFSPRRRGFTYIQKEKNQYIISSICIYLRNFHHSPIRKTRISF